MSSLLNGKHILLGVSGGIAAYKAADVCSKLVKHGADVHVIMTENAQNFITTQTFEALCHHRTLTDTFDRTNPAEVEHIARAEEADLVLIAPATANIIGKLANGIADDMLSTSMLAVTCPKLIAPAMNTHMWMNPAVQANVARLREWGWTVIEPASGHLACGTTGAGKLPEPEILVQHVLHTIACPKDMCGMKVLVTAGPTCEDLDPVRFLSNRSSGKMGFQIAAAASSRGAEVLLISGPTALDTPIGVKRIDIRSAWEMYDAVTSHSDQQDIIIKAAAVADFRPANVSEDKIKKSSGAMKQEAPVIPLERTDDILGHLGNHKKEGQFLCGFSMETQNLIENSRKKLEKKHLDLVAANNVKIAGAGFQGDTNVLTLISRNSETELPLLSKWDAANALLDEILRLRH